MTQTLPILSKPEFYYETAAHKWNIAEAPNPAFPAAVSHSLCSAPGEESMLGDGTPQVVPNRTFCELCDVWGTLLFSNSLSCAHGAADDA
jgi:hypothetical protein